MHEISIVTNIFTIIEDIARQNNLVRVTRVCLHVGRMRQVVPMAMDMAFQAVTKDTIADSAVLEIQYIPVIMRCRACGKEFTVEEHVFLCPSCDFAGLDLLQGNELIITHLEGEDVSPG